MKYVPTIDGIVEIPESHITQLSVGSGYRVYFNDTSRNVDAVYNTWAGAYYGGINNLKKAIESHQATDYPLVQRSINFLTAKLANFIELQPLWQPFDTDFEYVKDYYEVMLQDGTVVQCCWPNAGRINSASDNSWGPEDNVLVRPDLLHSIGD